MEVSEKLYGQNQFDIVSRDLKYDMISTKMRTHISPKWSFCNADGCVNIVWQFQNFSVTQILREIRVGEI